jgi:hypothetical protein
MINVLALWTLYIILKSMCLDLTAKTNFRVTQLFYVPNGKLAMRPRPVLSCHVQLELFHTPKILKHTDYYITQNSTLFHALSHLYLNSVASSSTIVRNIFASHHSYVQAWHSHTAFICLLLIRLNSADRSAVIGIDTEDGESNSLVISPKVATYRRRHVLLFVGLGSCWILHFRQGKILKKTGNV